MLASVRDANASGAARRRQRRLRQWLRHERLSVAMALAEMSHHTAPRGQKTARAREEDHEMHYTATVRTHPPHQVAGTEYYELSDEDVVPARGSRPPCLGEPRGPQERDLPRTVEQIAVYAPMVQILDAPVTQMVEQLPDVMRFFDFLLPDPEQVIEVPKILLDEVPMRTVVRDTQLAEQPAEVPTILYFLKQRIPEQIVDTPVPYGGRGVSGGLQGFLPGHVEQTVDFPAPCSSVRRLQGFLPEQSSTVTSSSSSERISERNVEQIAVSRGFGEGLQDFLPGQSSSSSSHGPARIAETLDEPGEGGFSHFSPN